MVRGLFLAGAAALIVLGTCSPAASQDASRAMVLGVWEGKVTFGESAPAVLQFAEAAGGLTWSYSFKYDPVLWGDAAGTVTSFSPPALELNGAWTKHAVSGAAGTRVKLILTIDGDQMKGTMIAEMNNTPVQVSLTRKR